jgi:hypothetical protein
VTLNDDKGDKEIRAKRKMETRSTTQRAVYESKGSYQGKEESIDEGAAQPLLLSSD